jgi:glycosyltransferase involved in cell wall biosynthesis
MATYNGAKYIEEQLSSLAAQTLRPAELIVGDDGSTDATLELVRNFAEISPFPVKILASGARLGFADNALRTAEACSGQFIAFCDQDDIWLPDKLERCATRLERDNSLIALHTMTLIDGAGHPYWQWAQGITGDNTFRPLELDPYCTGWGNSMVFSRDLVHLIAREKRPRQPEEPHRPLSHDTWVYMLAAALGNVSHLKKPLILYRQHGGNAMGVGPWDWEQPSLKNRLTKVGLHRLHERKKVNERMAELLSKYAEQGGRFSHEASKAAQIYLTRSELVSARISLFTDHKAIQRLRAFRKIRKSQQSSRTIGSGLKEFLLGVLGLHQHIQRIRGYSYSGSRETT